MGMTNGCVDTCPALKFALEALGFKFLPLLQGTDQLKLSQAKWLHPSLSRHGVYLVDHADHAGCLWVETGPWCSTAILAIHTRQKFQWT